MWIPDGFDLSSPIILTNMTPGGPFELCTYLWDVWQSQGSVHALGNLSPMCGETKSSRPAWPSLTFDMLETGLRQTYTDLILPGPNQPPAASLIKSSVSNNGSGTSQGNREIGNGNGNDNNKI